MQLPTLNPYWVLTSVFIGIVLLICVKNYKKSHPKYPDFTPMDYGVRRSDGNMVFYSSIENQLHEVKHFTNYHWEAFYGGVNEGISRMHSSPHPIVLDLSYALFGSRGKDGLIHLHETAASNLESLLSQLINAGVFHKIQIVVLIDEPNLNTTREDYEAAMNIVYSALSATSTPQIKIGVIYQGGVAKKPEDYWCFHSHDIVGFDDYKRGNYIFAPGEEFSRMYDILRNQQMWLVPGATQTKGAKPLDPAAFEIVFHNHPNVWGFVPFLWSDIDGIKGIRNDSEQVRKYRRLYYDVSGQSSRI